MLKYNHHFYFNPTNLFKVIFSKKIIFIHMINAGEFCDTAISDLKHLKCFCFFCRNFCYLPFGAFRKLNHNGLPVNRESWLESLQDLKQLRCLLLTEHTEIGELVKVQLYAIV